MTCGETVYIVDGDNESRARLCELIHGMKLHYEAYGFAHEFLQRCDKHCRGCVILDLLVPDLCGLNVQEQLAARCPGMPVIFHSARPSVPSVVQAIQCGAVNFLEKPAGQEQLWENIQRALHLDRKRRAEEAEHAAFQEKLEVLTDKEIDVLKLIAQDQPTRSIARELDVAVRTVEFRRARMLKKLEFKTLMELAHFAIRAFDGKAQQHLPQAKNDDEGMTTKE